MLRYVLPFCLVATAADAGWLGAEWGASQDEVIEAIGLAPVSRDKGFVLFDTEVRGIRLYLSFKFLGGKLGRASGMAMEGTHCAELAGIMSDTYGVPESTNNSATTATASLKSQWRDVSNDNIVTLDISIAGDKPYSCSVGYGPIPKANTGGF